jgi:hypothetical protein
VGLSDAATECGASWDCEGWEWTDGSAYDYTFWGPGQPNDDEYAGQAQDCAYLNPDYNWLIGDEDCGNADTADTPATNRHQWRSLCQKPYAESLAIAGFALWDQWCDAGLRIGLAPACRAHRNMGLASLGLEDGRHLLCFLIYSVLLDSC